MTPPQPGRGSAADSNGPQEPALRSLPKLRDCKTRLSKLLEDIDISPDELDVQARLVHKDLVMPVYELMRTEVAQACGSRWDPRDRRRFADTYHAAASKWPVYREALAELERARDLDTSVNDAMVRLERPRSDYIAALLDFYGEFSSTLDFFFPPEVGSAPDSVLQSEPRHGPVTEAMTPPQPGRGSAADSNGPQEPALRSLPKLRDCKTRLSKLLEDIDISPDELDVQARLVHKDLVMPVYELMRTEVAQACGSRWDPRDRRRFADTYHAAASKWPVYREALAELERARDLDTSVNDAMVRLERPRSDYIAALLDFYGEFSSTLDFFFPP